MQVYTKLIFATIFSIVQFVCLAQVNTALSIQTGHSDAINTLKFSQDGTKLLSIGDDDKVIIWDIPKRKQIQIISLNNVAVRSADFHPNKAELAVGTSNGTVKIIDLTSNQEKSTITTESDMPVVVKYNASGDNLYIGGTALYFYDFNKGELTTSISNNITFLTYNTSETQFAVVFESGKVGLFDAERKEIIKTYRGKFNKVSFSEDQKYLYGAGKNGILKKWAIEGSQLLKGMTISQERPWNSFTDVDVNESVFVGANKDASIYVRKHRSGKLTQLLRAHQTDVKSLAIDPTGKLLASAGEDRQILLWSLENGELIGSLHGIGMRINDLVFGASGQKIAIAYDAPHARITSLNEEMKTTLFEIPTSFMSKIRGFEYSISDVIEYKEGEILTVIAHKKLPYKREKEDREYKVDKYTTATWSLKNNALSMDKWQRTFTSEEEIHVHDISTSEVAFDKLEHTDRVTALAQNPIHPIYASGSWDGTVKIHDANDSLLLTYAAFGDNDYILTNNDNYYYATKGALRNVGFWVNGEVLAFDQFDAKYNRPDLVFKQLPYISQLTVKNYELAYQKRLSKLDINPIDLNITTDIPEVKIAHDKIDFIVKNRELELPIILKASSLPIASYSVEINGVPISTEKINSTEKLISKNISLTLNAGKNEITVYASDAKGVNSYRETALVTCQANLPSPDLYLVNIGVSNYEQSDYNLTFAAKDAQDIQSHFAKSKQFNEVHSLLLTDEKVTKSSIADIEAFIKNADPQDVVIISIAGHGVLSDELDYYLGTYDIDFTRPENKGIAYDDLEGVLSRTPARQKVLLLDACHSGEVDKDELEKTHEEATFAGNITFRAVGTNVKYNNTVGLKSSFELSKQLFADMRSSNGAVVISSAGAAEYAFEGDNWHNGLFTYVFLEGLKSNNADLNHDGKIMLSEIQKYLFTQVQALSDGKQTPTSRVENLNNDFRIK